MKKITLLALLLGALSIQAQTFTTGEITLSSDYTAQIDVTSTDVTITMEGPDDRWLGLGFGVTTMTAGEDVVTFDSSGFNDREFQGVGVTPTTDTQDWTVVSNTSSGGVRTLVATRNLTGSDTNDYEFDPNDTSILLVWARGNGTLDFSNHGQGNRGQADAGFALGILDEVLETSLEVYPNPSKDIVNVRFNSDGAPVNIKLYNTLGQVVSTQKLSSQESLLDMTSLKAGIYILEINTDNATATRRLIKQ